MASNSAREANRIYTTNAFTGGGAKVVSLVHMDCVAPPLNLTEQKTAPEQASTPLCERGDFVVSRRQFCVPFSPAPTHKYVNKSNRYINKSGRGWCWHGCCEIGYRRCGRGPRLVFCMTGGGTTGISTVCTQPLQ